MDNKKVSGFIYGYEGKNYIPVPIFESLGLTSQVPRTNIPQCGECVALEDFAEVQKNGISIQLYPFSSYQDSDNRITLRSNPARLSDASEQTWAYWVNYRGRFNENYSLFLDNNLSTPWGTLNGRTNINENHGLELQNVQFVHENINDEYEVIVGDINTTRLAWGGSYGLVGVGYFTTDPRLNDVYGLARDLAIDIDTHTELEVIANGQTVYKGFQGAGQFIVEDIFSSGLIDVVVKRNSETADYYQFYFDTQALPEGDTNWNVALGQFNRGPFRYDYGLAASVEYGITNSTWFSSSFLGTENNYIAGINAGISTAYGALSGGYSESSTGSQFDFGYRYSYKNFSFSASYIDDNALDVNAERSLTTFSTRYRIGNVNVSANYTRREANDVYATSLSTTFSNGISLSGNVQHSNSETSFFATINFSFSSLGGASVSLSDNDIRGFVRGFHKTDDYQMSYGLSHSREQGGLAQLSASNRHIQANARYNMQSGAHAIDVNGSLVFDGKSLTALRDRVQSLGILEAHGGDITVNGRFKSVNVGDGDRAALNLAMYRDTEFRLSSRDVTSSLETPNALFSSGRKGAYKVRALFSSPGSSLAFSAGVQGDVLVVGEHVYPFYRNVGFFVKGLPLGEYDANVLRNGKSICKTNFTMSSAYTVSEVQCEDKF